MFDNNVKVYKVNFEQLSEWGKWTASVYLQTNSFIFSSLWKGAGYWLSEDQTAQSYCHKKAVEPLLSFEGWVGCHIKNTQTVDLTDIITKFNDE